MDEFWNNVSLGGDDECWPWKADVNVRGYGSYRLQEVHEMIWEMTYAMMPYASSVIQECGNKKCCNPMHMKLRLKERQ